MGLREKVALVLIAVVIYKTVCSLCLPQSIKENPFEKYMNNLKNSKSRSLSKYTPKQYNQRYPDDFRKNIPKTYSFPENYPSDTPLKVPVYAQNSEYDVSNKKTSIDVWSDSALLNDLRKEKRRKRKNKPNEKMYSRDDLPLETFPESYHYQELFPEVQYPLTASEIWMPSYWNPLPSTNGVNFMENSIYQNKKLKKKNIEAFLQPSIMKEMLKTKDEIAKINSIKVVTNAENDKKLNKSSLIEKQSPSENINEYILNTTKVKSKKHTHSEVQPESNKITKSSRKFFSESNALKSKQITKTKQVQGNKTNNICAAENITCNNHKEVNVTSITFKNESNLNNQDLRLPIDVELISSSLDKVLAVADNSFDDYAIKNISKYTSLEYSPDAIPNSVLIDIIVNYDSISNTTLDDDSTQLELLLDLTVPESQEGNLTAIVTQQFTNTSNQYIDVTDNPDTFYYDSVRQQILNVLLAEKLSVSSLKEDILKILLSEEHSPQLVNKSGSDTPEALSPKKLLNVGIAEFPITDHPYNKLTESMLPNISPSEDIPEFPVTITLNDNSDSIITDEVIEVKKGVISEILNDTHLLELIIDQPIDSDIIITDSNGNDDLSVLENQTDKTEKISNDYTKANAAFSEGSYETVNEPIKTKELSADLREIISKPSNSRALVEDLREIIRLLTLWNSQIDDFDEDNHKVTETDIRYADHETELSHNPSSEAILKSTLTGHNGDLIEVIPDYIADEKLNDHLIEITKDPTSSITTKEDWTEADTSVTPSEIPKARIHPVHSLSDTFTDDWTAIIPKTPDNDWTRTVLESTLFGSTNVLTDIVSETLSNVTPYNEPKESIKEIRISALKDAPVDDWTETVSTKTKVPNYSWTEIISETAIDDLSREVSSNTTLINNLANNRNGIVSEITSSKILAEDLNRNITETTSSDTFAEDLSRIVPESASSEKPGEDLTSIFSETRLSDTINPDILSHSSETIPYSTYSDSGKIIVNPANSNNEVSFEQPTGEILTSDIFTDSNIVSLLAQEKDNGEFLISFTKNHMPSVDNIVERTSDDSSKIIFENLIDNSFAEVLNENISHERENVEPDSKNNTLTNQYLTKANVISLLKDLTKIIFEPIRNYSKSILKLASNKTIDNNLIDAIVESVSNIDANEGIYAINEVIPEFELDNRFPKDLSEIVPNDSNINNFNDTLTNKSLSSEVSSTFTFGDIISSLTGENEPVVPISFVSTYNIPQLKETLLSVENETETPLLINVLEGKNFLESEEQQFENVCPIIKDSSFKNQCFIFEEPNEFNSISTLTDIPLFSVEEPIDSLHHNSLNKTPLLSDITLTGLNMGTGMEMNVSNYITEPFDNVTELNVPETNSFLPVNEIPDFSDYTTPPEDDTISDLSDNCFKNTSFYDQFAYSLSLLNNTDSNKNDTEIPLLINVLDGKDFLESEETQFENVCPIIEDSSFKNQCFSFEEPNEFNSTSTLTDIPLCSVEEPIDSLHHNSLNKTPSLSDITLTDLNMCTGMEMDVSNYITKPFDNGTELNVPETNSFLPDNEIPDFSDYTTPPEDDTISDLSDNSFKNTSFYDQFAYSLLLLNNTDSNNNDTETPLLINVLESKNFLESEEAQFENVCPIIEDSSFKNQCFSFEEPNEFNSTITLTDIPLFSVDEPIDSLHHNSLNKPPSLSDITLTDLIMGTSMELDVSNYITEPFDNVTQSNVPESNSFLLDNEIPDFSNYTTPPEDDTISDLSDNSFKNTSFYDQFAYSLSLLNNTDSNNNDDYLTNETLYTKATPNSNDNSSIEQNLLAKILNDIKLPDKILKDITFLKENTISNSDESSSSEDETTKYLGSTSFDILADQLVTNTSVSSDFTSPYLYTLYSTEYFPSDENNSNRTTQPTADLQIDEFYTRLTNISENDTSRLKSNKQTDDSANNHSTTLKPVNNLVPEDTANTTSNEISTNMINADFTDSLWEYTDVTIEPYDSNTLTKINGPKAGVRSEYYSNLLLDLPVTGRQIFNDAKLIKDFDTDSNTLDTTLNSLYDIHDVATNPTNGLESNYLT